MLIVDTGVLVAATDRNDPHHTASAELLTGEPDPTLYRSITDGQLQIEALTIGDWQRVHELVLTYADLRLGGTDASVIALAERHGAHRIATLNRRHFGVVRPRHTDAFTLLPAATG